MVTQHVNVPIIADVTSDGFVICVPVKKKKKNKTIDDTFLTVFNGVRVARSLVFYVMFCRSLFVLVVVRVA